MIIGYARVSTGEQNLDLQIDALKNAGCEEVFTDIASGVKENRPGLKDAFRFLREGDTLIVYKLDRLGRSVRNLIELTQQIAERKASFICLSEKIDTTTPTGKLIFHIFGALAEFERDLIRERSRAGMVAAKARGRMGGRPFSLDKKQAERLRELAQAKTSTVGEICKIFNITRPTFYAYLKGAYE
jgi:DNA invertase Pin-like site-specific DNA recombinase